MRRFNIANPAFSYDDTDPEGYRSGYVRPGPDLGAKISGATVYELPPGQSICPYHYEYAEEEWLLVLSGNPVLRDPDGTSELEPWDLVHFPTGPEGAHKVTNPGDETVRVLMFSNVVHPAVTVYPDSDKLGVFTGKPDENVIVERSSRVEYFRGES